MPARTSEATEKIMDGDYFPLVLRLVFRRVRIAAQAPIAFVMSVRLFTGTSAALKNFRKLHIWDCNIIVARDINRPYKHSSSETLSGFSPLVRMYYQRSSH